MNIPPTVEDDAGREQNGELEFLGIPTEKKKRISRNEKREKNDVGKNHLVKGGEVVGVYKF